MCLVPQLFICVFGALFLFFPCTLDLCIGLDLGTVKASIDTFTDLHKTGSLTRDLWL